MKVQEQDISLKEVVKRIRENETHARQGKRSGRRIESLYLR